MRSSAALLIVSLLWVRCTTDGGVTADTPPFTVRDSAGFEIVASTRPLWTDSTAWRVAQTPTFTIGVADGEEPYLLDGVVGAARLSDGRILIVDRGSAQLRFYDATGRFLHSVGRKGNGPGEFARPEHLVRMPGDSLAVWDAGFRPLNIFAPDGRFVRQHRVDTDRVMNTITMQRATEALTPLSDGSFIIHATLRASPHQMGVPPGVVYRKEMGFYRFRPDGVDSLGWYEGGLPNMYLEIGGRRVYTTTLITWHARLAASADARRVFITQGDPYEIIEFIDAMPVRIIRRDVPPVPIPAHVLASARERRSGTPEAARLLSALPPQTHYPAIDRLIVDSDGNLWVSTRAGEHHVFDTEGCWLGSVEVPGRLLDVGRDHVLTLTFDSLMVERVALYSLHR
jgi:hypothetical protein